MEFQVFSDIHIEVSRSYPKLPPKAPILFLAGDIGYLHDENFGEFMDYLSLNWKYVFYVLGNHEYYSDIDKDILESQYIEYFAKYTNIYLMNRTKISIFGIDILGCTLWSNPQGEYTDKLGDFHRITVGEFPCSLEKYREFYHKDYEWLLKNIDLNTPTIILTHYPTSIDLAVKNPLYPNQSKFTERYFHNSIEFPDNGVSRLFISGHTHWSFDYTKDSSNRYISNQVGYIYEKTALDGDGSFKYKAYL